MFSYLSPEQRVPADHPLRPIRLIVDRVLVRLDRQFEQMYSAMGSLRLRPRSCCERC